jgi:hypothetical protein
VLRSQGQEAKRGEAGGQRIPWNGEAMGSFSSRVRHRGIPERDRGLIGATPRGQPWTTAVTLSYGRNGLSARRMVVL